MLEGWERGSATETDQIEESEGGGKAEALGEVTRQARAEVPGAGCDEKGVDLGQPEAGFFHCFAGGGFRQPGGMLAEAADHFVRFKNEGILHLIERKVAGFDPVAVAEDLTEEGTGAGSQFMIFRGVFQGGENLGLREGAWGDCGADGVEIHGSSG